MRVLLLTTSFPSSDKDVQSPFLLHLVKALAKLSVKVDVVCPYREGSSYEYKLGGAQVHRFDFLVPKRLQTLTKGGGIPSNIKRSFFAKVQFFFLVLSMYAHLRKFLEKNKVDVIHAQWSLTGLIAVLVKKRFDVPVIITERGAALNLTLKSFLMKRFLMFAVNRAERVTANSEQQAEMLRGIVQGKEKVQCIPNGIDTTMFKPCDKKKARERLGIPEDQKVILFAGWLIPRKGVEYLLEALKMMKKDVKKAQVYLMGEGILKEELQRKVKELGIENDVVFLGVKTQQELAEYMGASDVFVLPSLSEGRANVIAEALACGAPVVASRVGDASMMMEEGVNGFLVNPQDSEDLAEKIKKVLADEGLRRKLAENLRRVKERVGTWEVCAKEYLKVYNQVVR